MRIHTQLLAALAASIGLALVAALATVHAAQREDQASSIQARAQTTAHEVSGLLVLTQEYARHSEPRAAQQWHQRHSAIAVVLAGEDAATGAALAELRAVTQALPQLFARLEEIARGDDAFSLRRKEVLLDQLLVSTQAMSDNAYRWHQDAAQARRDAQTQFETIAFATPVAMLVVLALVAAIVRQRVLRPLRRLDDAAAAVGAGDLSVRIASDARDARGELGDLSRRFDAMTEALQRSGEQVRRSEKRLRAITDHIPALVGYFDADERCHFANDMALRVHGLQGTDVTRLTLRSGIGDENYALHEPHVRKVLQGQACAFEGHLVRRGREVHYQAHLVPDRCDSGVVQGFYLMTFDVTALKTVGRQLKALVELDALTGLPNRRQYDHRLPEAMRRADRNGRALALMFLDIDHFKSINDLLGHAAGDAVLKAFAQRLAGSVRATDTVARLAGDEFVIILEGLNSEAEPQFVARQIIARVSRPIEFEGRRIDVTTSVGVACYDGSSGTVTPSQLLARADEALYRAKGAGRNTFRVA